MGFELEFAGASPRDAQKLSLHEELPVRPRELCCQDVHLREQEQAIGLRASLRGTMQSQVLLLEGSCRGPALLRPDPSRLDKLAGGHRTYSPWPTHGCAEWHRWAAGGFESETQRSSFSGLITLPNAVQDPKSRSLSRCS